MALAIAAGMDAFLVSMKDFTQPDGRDGVVRHGDAPERTMQAHLGPVPARRA